jgi:hypothetical protein
MNALSRYLGYYASLILLATIGGFGPDCRSGAVSVASFAVAMVCFTTGEAGESIRRAWEEAKKENAR